MDEKYRKHVGLFFGFLILIMIGAFAINALYPAQSRKSSDTPDSSDFYVIKDAQNRVLLETGLPISVDDEFIAADNIHYLITALTGNEAVASLKSESSVSQSSAAGEYWASTSALRLTESVPAQAGTNHHVVLYHTHSDESFLPTSGKASKPAQGDIYEVGTAFKNALSKNGISVTQSVNAHGPHDANAYNRSRRTAYQLLKEQPDAIFDIHRDSAPLRAYATTIDGVDTARIMIVVGRSNPHMKTNLEYARKIKAAVDDLYPGLMRGIFIGRGDYNQDLYPTALLFEVGTEGNSLDAVQKSVNCLSDAVSQVITR